MVAVALPKVVVALPGELRVENYSFFFGIQTFELNLLDDDDHHHHFRGMANRAKSCSTWSNHVSP